MDVPANRDRSANWLHIAFILEYFLGFFAEPLNVVFGKRLASIELGDECIECLGRIIVVGHSYFKFRENLY